VAETVGLILLSATAATEIGTGVAGLGTLAASTIGGTSVATAVGGTAILAASIGLSYALSPTPNVPKPEAGSQALKQAIPPRIRGYWDSRLAGSYVLYHEANRTSYDVQAFHHGRVESILHFYLHDQEVTLSPDISGGGVGTVATVGADQFGGGRVQIEVKLGAASQTTSALFASDPDVNTLWTAGYRGDGIAYACLKCGAFATPELFSRGYPQGKPEISLVARCSPIWDPRDPAQDREDESTWVASPNPVLQLIDYLTRADGGMGLDLDTILPSAMLAQWMIEADICDEDVGGEARYESAGWYQFDNKPEDVIGKILATCDGHMLETGDGTLALTVGKYRAPTESSITDEHIFGFVLNHGHSDEETVNQLEITYTDPSQQYAQAQTDPVRDEVSIATTGVVRSRSLDLSWVQSPTQAERLGLRALVRLNTNKTGSFVTKLYGLRYLGKRWVNLNYTAVNGLQDCVVEIQSAEVNILTGRITWSFIRVGSLLIRLVFTERNNSMYVPVIFDDI
jgi:hypothetical protein